MMMVAERKGIVGTHWSREFECAGRDLGWLFSFERV